MRGASHLTSRTLATAGALAALLALPSAALAGEARVDSGIARFQAFSNEANSLAVAELPASNPAFKKVLFRDVIGMRRGPDCAPASPLLPNGTSLAVECTVPVSTNLIRAGLEDNNDRLQPALSNAPVSMRFSSEGDGQNDTLIGTEQNDVLDGVGGADNLHGRGGDDKLEGAGGDDDVLGQNGEDTMTGGAGADDLIGGADPDDMFGNGGNDNLNADDNARGDFVDCGEHLFDNDLAVVNQGDTVTNCERLQIVP